MTRNEQSHPLRSQSTVDREGLRRFRKATHRCPRCLGSFLGAAKCRGTADKGFHETPVQALPIVGCEEPPERRYTIVLRSPGIMASTPTRAREMAVGAVQRYVGGDTRRGRQTIGEIECLIDAVPAERIEPPGEFGYQPIAVQWGAFD